MRGLQRDLRHHLIPGAPGADHRDALAFQIGILWPPRRVPGPAFEGFRPGDVRNVRPIEEAHGRDHRAGTDRAGAVRPDHVDYPFARRFVPGQGFDLGLELDVLAQVEIVGDPVEVFHILPPFAERVRIGEIDAEQMRVGPAGRIDARAGIAVFPPGAADALVLLDDGEREPGLAQLQRGVQPAHAGTDDRDGEVLQPRGIGRLPPMQCPHGRVERHFLDVMAQIVALHGSPEHQPQAGAEPFPRPDVDVARAAVAVGFQEIGPFAPEQRHIRVGRRHRDVEVAGQHRPGLRRRDLRIAGQLIQQAPQHHGVGMGDRVLDRRIVRRQQFRSGRHSLLAHRPGTPPSRYSAPVFGGQAREVKSNRSRHRSFARRTPRKMKPPRSPRAP